MKFSFDAKKYRENLSKEILEKRRLDDNIEAVRILHEKQNSHDYQIAKKINRLNKNEKINRTKEYIQEERNNIFLYMEQKGFDVIDLSGVTPDEINIFIDEARLFSLGESMKSSFQTKERNEMVSRYLDKITEGAYSNPKNMHHVVDAQYGQGDFKIKEHTKEGSSYSFLYKPLDFGLNGICWVSAGGSDHYAEMNPSKPLIIFTLDNPVFRKILQDQYDESLNQSVEETLVKIKGENYYQIYDENAHLLPNAILNDLPIHNATPLCGSYFKFNNPKLLRVLNEYGYTQEDKSIFTWPLISSYIIDLKDKIMFKFNPKKSNKTE